MRKSGLFKITLLIALSGIAFLSDNSACAQSKYIEFKFGGICSSPINNTAPPKTISDIRSGITIGISYGYEFKNEIVRLYGEIYYTGKGEKYDMNDDGTFNSSVCYFQTYPNIRICLLGKGIYFGVGPYAGYAVSRNVTSGDMLDQSHYINKLEYYKKIDFGPRCAIGGEFGIGSMKIMTELAYEYGLQDISNRSERAIKNQSVLLTIGTSFQITNKHYRHY